MALIWFLFLLQPFLPAIALATVGAFDLQDGAVADLIADARLLAFELIPVCVNSEDRSR